MINQGVARAFARVRRPGLLTFAAVSEVGVSGRRVGGGHSLNSQAHDSTVFNALRIVFFFTLPYGPVAEAFPCSPERSPPSH